MPDDPTTADILVEIDRLGAQIAGRFGRLDDRLTGIDTRLNLLHGDVQGLRSDFTRQIGELRDDMRSLWTEHLGHTHPRDS